MVRRPTHATHLAAVLLLVFTTACGVPKSGLMQQLGGNALVPTPAPDTALVVFMRPNKLGYKISAAVYEDNAFRGIVMHRARLAFEATPGPHRYMVVSEAADFLDAELVGGSTYYIEVAPRMGAWRARFSLVPITPQSGQWSKVDRWVADSYGVAPNDAGEAWAESNSASVTKKRDAYLVRWLEKSDRPALAPGDGVTRP